ncbi:MAG TPA: hypothetical protein VGI15_02280 [Candidatus Cybelea sp.]
MNRRLFIIALLLGAGAVVAVGGMLWQMFSSDQAQRYRNVQRVERAPSRVAVSLDVDYASGPVAHETYRMSDENGHSDASYAVTDRSGTTARFRETVAAYGVSFLFEKLVADGIWELTDRPPRGNTSIRYTTTVAQTVAEEQGRRSATFTDPHYWATTAGRQYQIHLDPNKPVPDLLTLKSTSAADPHYERVVTDIRNFGSPAFKATIRKARERLGLPS